MQEGFLEVIFPAEKGFDLDARDDFEGWIDGLLSRAKLGQVHGAGMGLGVALLEVTIFKPENTPQAVDVLLKLLRDRNAPAGTVIHERKPEDQVHRV
ncbi:hypothetical protein [Deinococcus roseus]|uniref:Uncharacterized protein n=1 Tax=Deinococcus roseus TaxID=392414 RepID=A0ABQ2D6A6_9DEIO|nr:hypothetical protein [Deinococcus roseus]GGJ46241.1 hypothetical protein GCM10008938_35560 [Deinococcus roseus]